MDDQTLVRNEDIDHNVSVYLRKFGQLGGVSFELHPEQYAALQRLTKSFDKARKSKEFSLEKWIKKATDEGLIDNKKAFFVFCFLSLIWNSGTQITAQKRKAHIQLDVMRRAARH